ncbi:conserved hypothetical protein [uncultured Gammaproteobacteria bacterium]
MTTKSTDEFIRVSQLVSHLTVSVPVMIMTREQVERITQEAATDSTLAALDRELRAKFKAVTAPEDHVQMAQAYEAYSEASFYLAMKDRGVVLERTPGTGGHQAKRPDFRYSHASGHLYFEVKALEIAEPLRRHKEIGHEALEIAAELDGRAREPGVHFGKPHEISGHLPNADSVARIDDTIQKISNNIKAGQIEYGPTVLVIDLGRLSSIAQGPSGLLPVFFHEAPPAESCVSGELWQVALGLPGEQILSLPEFDGRSNLAGHQTQTGILRQFPTLMAITFFLPRWSDKPELLTIWNVGWNQTALENASTLQEHEIEAVLHGYSDGLNDQRNQLGWKYRVSR